MQTADGLDLKAILNDWFTTMWNKKDITVIDKYVSPESTLHGHGEAPLCGPEAFYALHKQLFSVFSNIRVTILHSVAEGLTVASRNRADFVNASTGRRTSVQFASMVTFNEHGKVVQAWDTVDWYSYLVQIHALPSDALFQSLEEDRSFR